MLLIVVGLAFFQYYTSDKLALAAAGARSRHARGGARAARHGRAALRDGRPAEAEVAIMDTPVPNAFATGRSPKHAAVCVTTGPLGAARAEGDRGRPRPRALAHREPRRPDHDRRQLLRHARRAAHPLRPLRRHVRRRRRRDNNNGPPVWLIVSSSPLIIYVISFILIRMISRYREYAADRGSALITGAPEYLMSALQKISSQMTLIPNQDLRQVQGMSAFFIIPAKVQRRRERALHGSPASREAHRGPRRDRSRDGPPGRLSAWPLRDVLFGRRSSPSRRRTGSSR